MIRRKFLTSSFTVPFGVPILLRGQNLNSKIQLAAVGTEGRGWADIDAMSTHLKTETVAFCDVDLSRTAKVRRLNPKAEIFQDYREMLSTMDEQVDAVTIGIPDHMHAPVVINALNRNKHVYCEKPLTHTVWEARQVRLHAEKAATITRMGNQIHSHSFYRTAVRIIQEGMLGKIDRVHSWINATGHGKSGAISRPSPSPIPNDLDWNLWIGCAPMRPFVTGKIYHPWGWRDWQDFGNGALGDFGCHVLDPVFTALKLTQGPLSIKCSYNSGMNDEVWPAQNVVQYNFDGTKQTNANFSLTWYDGGRKPKDLGPHFDRRHGLPNGGSIFIGEKGSLVLPHVGSPKLYPEESYPKSKIPFEESLNHYHGFLDGIITSKQPSDGFSYAGRLTETVLLGNIAVRNKGKLLNWNEEDMSIRSSEEDLSSFLTKKYRTGWEIPLA